MLTFSLMMLYCECSGTPLLIPGHESAIIVLPERGLGHMHYTPVIYAAATFGDFVPRETKL